MSAEISLQQEQETPEEHALRLRFDAVRVQQAMAEALCRRGPFLDSDSDQDFVERHGVAHVKMNDKEAAVFVELRLLGLKERLPGASLARAEALVTTKPHARDALRKRARRSGAKVGAAPRGRVQTFAGVAAEALKRCAELTVSEIVRADAAGLLRRGPPSSDRKGIEKLIARARKQKSKVTSAQ